MLILILKPFAKLYRLIVPKGGHRGFAFFTSSLLSMIIALSIIGSVLAKRNIKNSFYSVADAQDTSEEVSETNTQQASAGELLKQANSKDEQDQASANSNTLSDAESAKETGNEADNDQTGTGTTEQSADTESDAKENTDEEVAEGKNAIRLLGGAEPSILHYEVPGLDASRTLVVSEKRRPTPSKYPRRFAQMKKQPL